MTNLETTYSSRYAATAELLKNQSGSLIDLGSRDRRLKDYLHQVPNKLNYFSADLEGSNDFAINLERPLQFHDKQFDVVCILDVLEHLENIHCAFDECLRIAKKKVIISLPNLSTLPQRYNYLRRGKLKTGKYDLLSTHQGDRHRWLTTFENTINLLDNKCNENGSSLRRIVGCRDFYEISPFSIVNKGFTAATQILMSPALYCHTLVFEVEVNESACN